MKKTTFIYNIIVFYFAMVLYIKGTFIYAFVKDAYMRWGNTSTWS